MGREDELTTPIDDGVSCYGNLKCHISVVNGHRMAIIDNVKGTKEPDCFALTRRFRINNIFKYFLSVRDSWYLPA